MARYMVEQSFEAAPGGSVRSGRAAAVAEMFGLGMEAGRRVRVLEPCEIRIEPGQVAYVTGASGAGKSVVLRLLREQWPGAVELGGQSLPEDEAVVDCFGEDLEQALYWLSLAGLSEAFALLRRCRELSDGQRYRLRLALVLARRPKAVFIDEFCAALDRVTAGVVAHNVRKAADRFGTTFVVATSHDDLLEDLCPDVVVVKHLGSGCDVYYPARAGRD